MLINTQPPSCLHVIYPHLQPPRIAPCLSFIWHAWNRATATQILWFWPNFCPLASCWQTCSPLTASVSFTHTHNLPASPYATISHGMPETEPWALGFGILAQSPPPGLTLANMQPPQPPPCHIPTPTTSMHHPMPLFYMAYRKPSDGCSFPVFSPNLPCTFGSQMYSPTAPISFTHSHHHTIVHCLFTQHTQNPAHLLSFRFLSFLIIF